MIKSMSFIFLAVAIALPACALEASPSGSPDDPTGTTRQADPKCPPGYEADPTDGTCLITSDPASTPPSGGDTTVIKPIGGPGSGTGAGGIGIVVNPPFPKQAACETRCDDAEEACVIANPKAALTCRKTWAMCLSMCGKLYPAS